jgi:hypothetical protein
MRRGPRGQQTLDGAVDIARERGLVHVIAPGRDTLFDLAITMIIPMVFVRAKFTEKICAAIDDITADFHEEIRRLRLVAQDSAHTCELWLRSRYGTWRFFRVTRDTVVEIQKNGQPKGE